MALQQLHPQRPVHQVVLVGTAVSRFVVPAVVEGVHPLVVHGELDDTVALSEVLDWARAQNLPVVVVPGASHFFHGQLGVLKALVVRHLGAAR
jgi:alpha/beta superfamily hydrolase